MRTTYIYGAPASGKTHTSRRLAAETGLPLVDLDAEIARRAGKSIPEIFATDGEAAFRRLESETLRSVRAPLVSLGGGSLVNPENRAFAEANGLVVLLDVDEATILRRIAAEPGTRPLGATRLKERGPHYASFPNRARPDAEWVFPSPLRGEVTPPVSKSHQHRLLVARFLAGARDFFDPLPEDSDDIRATRRCLAALADPDPEPVLDCGESGSTLRFLAPVAAALGRRPRYILRGRLAERPRIEYPALESGIHELDGGVSSQYVTGLLFALPLLPGDSEIRIRGELQSRGYVDPTLSVLERFGVRVETFDGGFRVPGSQTYRDPGPAEPERDWSGAAFWLAANTLGADIEVLGLDPASRQPDCRAGELLARLGGDIDVSGCPDLLPALAVAAAGRPAATRFVNAARLRIKESDRIAAMESVLRALGVRCESTEDTLTVHGTGGPFRGCVVDPRHDHRIAMAAAIAAIRADGPVVVNDPGCVAKSYPGFFDELRRLRRFTRVCVTLGAATLEEDLADLEACRASADMAELRADRLADADPADVAAFPARAGLPCILTVRRERDGGSWTADEESRAALLKAVLEAGADFAFVDFEDDFRRPDLDALAAASGARVIRSLHDFDGPVPDVVGRCRALRGGTNEIPKIAFMPRCAADVERLFREAADFTEFDHILCAMGPLGVESRLRADALHSFLSFASPAGGTPNRIGHTDPATLAAALRARKGHP